MKISVVVATYNSEKYIESFLKLLTYQEVDEVIIADKGSIDSTVGIARQFGADISRTLYSSLGDLWNAGYSLCSNEIIWFLQPNCKLPIDGASLILDEMEDEPDNLIGGYFKTKHINDNFITHTKKNISSFFNKNIKPETGIFALSTEICKNDGFPDNNNPASYFINKMKKMVR